MNYVSPDTKIGNYQICDGSEQCINNWGGGGQGTLLRFYHYVENNTNNQWNWWYEGDVSGPQTWPFTAGSGINSYYNTKPVYKFAWAPNGHGSGNCISQQLFTYGDNGSQLNTTSCACSTCQTQSGAKLQFFVLAGGGRLVAVHATNDWVAYTGNNSGRVWVGVDTTDGDGHYVYLVTNQTYALTGFAAFA